jgi:tetratricopeptide (TPR) repeat protein
MKKFYHFTPAAFVALGLCLASAPASADFGWTKKTATLVRVSPPKVFLMGTRINVKASSQSPANQALAEKIRSQLESSLISSDNRLSADVTKPEVLVDVTVLQNDYSESTSKRQETQQRQVGKDAKGKPVYQSYDVMVDYKTVSYAFGASYKVNDLVKGGSLDADNVRFELNKDYREGTGAPEKFNLESSGAESVVNKIVPRLTPTREKIGVLLPKGPLETYLPLGENGLWSKYLEALSGLSANPKPIEESYRQYALGTAYEALGYAADDPDTTLKYLEQAASCYNRAIEANPGEKFFSKPYESLFGRKTAAAPLDRAKQALGDYRRIKEFKESYEKMQVAAKSAPLEGGKSLDRPARPSDAVDNVAVIQMVQSGLSEDIILTSINAAPHCNFDISPKGLVELSQAKVSAGLIKRIQEIATKGNAAKGKPGPKKKAAPKKG